MFNVSQSYNFKTSSPLKKFKQNLKSPKSNLKYNEKLLTIYKQMAQTETQKTHPFGISEKRFEWTKNLSNGNDLKPISRMRKSDNLEGGIGRFLNKKKVDLNRTTDDNYARKIKLNNNAYRKTQRVIYPNHNNEIYKSTKKKTFEQYAELLRHRTDGTYKSLIDKTPNESFPLNQGKKKLNSSMEYSFQPTNMFSEKFLCDPNYTRIFGVDRKKIIKKPNSESQPLMFDKNGRKHFKNVFYQNTAIY